jgi:protein farnesyltransferase subunit beta
MDIKESFKVNEMNEKYPELEETGYLFDQTALQEYILLCAQDKRGGFKDKPSRNRDYYHTCYSLSGLSISQNNRNNKSVLGDFDNNLLKEINPVYNICVDKVFKIFDYFEK